MAWRLTLCESRDLSSHEELSLGGGAEELEVVLPLPGGELRRVLSIQVGSCQIGRTSGTGDLLRLGKELTRIKPQEPVAPREAGLDRGAGSARQTGRF